MRNRVHIFDTTLRDGEQSCGCSMNVPEKMKMARKLVDLNVDVMEAGFPMASQGDFDAVDAIGREYGQVTVAALARCHAGDIERAAKALEKAKRIVIMDAVEIPGNVGTILRALDGLGESALVLTNKRVRLTHPKVVKGSLGAIFTVPLVTTEPHGILDYLAKNRIPLFAADSSSKAKVVDFSEAKVPERFALVLGSEKYGIPQEIYDAQRTGIKIPMAGVCDSLNVSIAGAILLYGLVMRK